MSKLDSNTAQLELLLEKVNALPPAGSGGTDTSDATAVAEEIFAGETAYVADGKITGTFTIDTEIATQDDLIAQLTALIATKVNYNTLYISTTEPTDDIGVDGDIYIVKGATT